MSRKILCGPSWRPMLINTAEDGAKTYRIGTGTIDGIAPDNHSGAASPLEVEVNNSEQWQIVWLEVTLQLGGDYGMRATACTLKAAVDPTLAGWADYPAQWQPEESGTARIVLCTLLIASKPERIVGRNLLTVAPIMGGCNAMYKIWGDAEGIDSIDNYFIPQRGVFFCYPSKADATVPDGIDLSAVMFT